MERRDFLKNGSFFAVSVSLLGIGCITRGMDGMAQLDDCDPTTKDILGPFYRYDSPRRHNIRLENDLENLVLLKGQVIDQKTCSPIPNAIIDFWQADGKGGYDNDSDEYRYRAQMLSDENGAYHLETIMPGRYLNGNQFRPSHIHMRIQAPGYQELVSQLYFKGDQYIEDDPWASDPRAEDRILEQTELETGELSLQFDFVLKNIS